MIEALLWDVDGTLAETESDGHRVAFNRAFEAQGLSWRWDDARHRELLRTPGGRERLLVDMASRHDAPRQAHERDALARELLRLKNGFYAEIVGAGLIPLRPGVREMLDEAAERGVAQAVVTTRSLANVEALLGCQLGADWRRRFAAVISGEDVSARKPDPEAYRLALAALGRGADLEPLSALAIEDAYFGAAAAQAAGVPVLVTRSACFADDRVENVVAYGPGLHTRRGWRPALPGADERGAEDGRVTLDDLADWHARMELVSSFG